MLLSPLRALIHARLRAKVQEHDVSSSDIPHDKCLLSPSLPPSLPPSHLLSKRRRDVPALDLRLVSQARSSISPTTRHMAETFVAKRQRRGSAATPRTRATLQWLLSHEPRPPVPPAAA
ncbi:Aste57867_9359 [Aphanomyces stellatus]|uniref:Aste57867_9359 protein n=1 Tax=Aphanomyces stellatus TaxID=120398 RepID=A0A485KMN4_9STRA|nr:hypothetical protein As57867_009323 [Aphanomyces stellatus]VFT86240.1 Aste57867_9359 [Aphanomyces stellatus]